MSDSVGLVNARGFTLIELMTVIAILGIFAAIAAPYTAAWRQNADVTSASSILELAYGKAKAVALRNPAQAYETSTGTSVTASGIKVENGALLVCAGSPQGGGCTVGGGATLWSEPLPDGVTITVNDDPMAVQGLNNRGQSIDSDGDPVALTYRIRKGVKSHEDTLR